MRARHWAIGYAVASCVAIGVGADVAAAIPHPGVACVDRPRNMFNECARIDASQVQDRRHHAPLPTKHEAVILAIQGDYLWTDGPLTSAEFAALLPVYRSAEATGLPCADEARTLQRTGDYRPDMRPCLGDEDSPAVDVILASVGR